MHSALVHPSKRRHCLATDLRQYIEWAGGLADKCDAHSDHGESKTILICDDDPLLLDLLEFRLVSRGFTVLVAQDGGEALVRSSWRR
jgi:PleD family two-component response regulator